MTEVVAVEMTAERARELTNQIRASLIDLRSALLEMYNAEGWTLLGYDNWRAWAEAEFENLHTSTLYRTLNAARLSAQTGESVPEIWARTIRQVLGSRWLDQAEEVLQLAAQMAPENERITAAHIQLASEQVYLRNLAANTNGANGHSVLVAAAAISGLAPTHDAYVITQAIDQQHSGGSDQSLLAVLSLCRQKELALRIVELYHDGYGELIAELARTQHINSWPEPTHISQATWRTLEAYLIIDSSERRAQRVEENRELYLNRRRAYVALEQAARRIVSGSLAGNAAVAVLSEILTLLESANERPADETENA